MIPTRPAWPSGAAGVPRAEQTLKSRLRCPLAGIVRDGLDRKAQAGQRRAADEYSPMERSNAGIYLALDVAQHWAGGQGLTG